MRYRVDGVLEEAESPPANLTAAVISRIKIMAKLNIAERRLPQDGRIMVRVQGKELDLRVSSVPTAHGESVVMRMLDRESVVLDFKALGFTDEFLASFMRVLEQPHGILLVTGPTGSGKTTTLYAALSQLNTPDVKIITVEDPVEYQIEGINQIQAKPQIGLDFAHALRTIVRQDPDIIMIGEMRDLETSRIAIQSALTGHLVLSTLHTNNAAGGITRLLDMGVEDYLLTSTVNGILAQRLVRTLEPTHAERYEALPEVIEEFGLRRFQPEGTIYLYRPKPSALSLTGYLGRSTIMEFLVMNDDAAPAGDAARRHGRDRGGRARRRHAHHVRGRPGQGDAGRHHDRGSPARDPGRLSRWRCSATRRCRPPAKSLDGQMEAASADEVIVRLQDQGYLPVEARRADERRRRPRPACSRRKRELDAAQVLQFTQQLATLLGAGQPLDRALQILLELPETDRGAQGDRAHPRDGARRRAAVGRARAAARPVLAPVREPGARRRSRRRAATTRCAAWPTTSSAAASCAAA